MNLVPIVPADNLPIMLFYMVYRVCPRDREGFQLTMSLRTIFSLIDFVGFINLFLMKALLFFAALFVFLGVTLHWIHDRPLVEPETVPTSVHYHDLKR